MKTYVLTISLVFPTTHPRKGDHTCFVGAIKSGAKKHSIRKNYSLWEKRFQKINRGEAQLSVRAIKTKIWTRHIRLQQEQKHLSL